MITHLELKNFMAFTDVKIDFSPKINVIIGKNGTGKTHLLKAAYFLSGVAPLFKNNSHISDKELVKELASALTPELLRLFLPLDAKLNKMRHHGGGAKATLEAHFAHDQQIAVSFSTRSKSLEIKIKDRNSWEQYQSKPVFFPTKEVLSFMEGFNSLYQMYQVSFDQTYQDICLLLDLPQIRPENLHEKSKWAMEELKAICGGRFIFYGGGKVTFRTEDSEYSANSIAEGICKVGMLYRLLETGALQPGVSGLLLWDEPESNMNPKLMKSLVTILLELSRNGQQIILATHDYVLLKWFDLLMDKSKGDHILFHTLYRDDESGTIKLDSVDNYIGMSPNAIADTFSDLIKQQANLKMGDLGK